MPLGQGARRRHRVGRGERRHDRRQAGAADAPRRTHGGRPAPARTRWSGRRGRPSWPSPGRRRPRARCSCATRRSTARRSSRCPAGLATLAVVGPHADREVLQGGGSARVTPTDVVTVAGGLREAPRRRGGGRGRAATPAAAPRPLEGRWLTRADGTTGVDVEILDCDGRRAAAPAAPGVPGDVPRRPGPAEAISGWTVRASARFEPPATGPHRFSLKTADEAALFVDGEAVGDAAGRSSTSRPDRPVELVVEARSQNPPARLVGGAAHGAARAGRRLRAGRGRGRGGRRRGGRHRPRRRLGDRGPRPRPHGPARPAGRARAGGRRRPAPHRRGGGGRRSGRPVVGGRGPGRCCGAGTRARRVAAASPTSSPAPSSPAAACRARCRGASRTPPPSSTRRRIRACSATRRACSAATAGTTPAASSRPSRSATAWGTRPSRSDVAAVADEAVAAGADVVVEVPVTNTGDRAGSEVVQLYVGDDAASVRRAPRGAARLRQGAPRAGRVDRPCASCSVRASSRSGTPAPRAGGPRPAPSRCGPAAPRGT